MKINWILDGEDVSVDRDPTESLSSVLWDLRLQTQPGCNREFVLFETRVYPADLLPLYRIRGKEVITARGFLSTPEGQRFFHLLEGRFGSACPLCSKQRLFLLDIDLEQHHSYQEGRLRQMLGMMPCLCGRENEYLTVAGDYFRETEKRRGHR